MEDFNDLESRLAALEQLAQAQQEKEAQAQQTAALQSIKDQYGMRFNNRDDVGMEILNQLARKGVDVSAASSNAVQDILDDMQAQVAQLYDDFNQQKHEMQETQNQAADLADQLNQIDETVKAATGGDMTNDEVPPPVEEPPMPEAPAPMPEEMAPPPVEEPPAPAPEPVPEPAPEPAPTDMAPPAPEPVTSDVTLKNVETPNPMGNNQSFFIKKTNKVNVAPSPAILSDATMKKSSFGRNLIDIARRGW